MYTIVETYGETQNEAIAIKSSATFYGDTTERCAFVWLSIAEKNGIEYKQPTVRFFEEHSWVDTRYPIDLDAAHRLADEWVKGSDEVYDRIGLAFA